MYSGSPARPGTGESPASWRNNLVCDYTVSRLGLAVSYTILLRGAPQRLLELFMGGYMSNCFVHRRSLSLLLHGCLALPLNLDVENRMSSFRV